MNNQIGKAFMKKSRKLTLEQRYQISAFLKAGWIQAQIARELRVAKSTILREIRRNGSMRSYNPDLANKRAKRRWRYANKRKKLTTHLQKMIRDKIKLDWSPEQVSGFLKRRHLASISHQTIYDLIKKDRLAGGSLYKHLRHGKKKRKKRYGSKDLRGQIKNRISIDERPKIVDDKKRVGDWEIDTVIGKNHKGVLVTIVERVTKFTLIGWSSNKSAKKVGRVTVKLLSSYKKLVHSITGDNGKEFALHEQISATLDSNFYFAHPYSSWERGLNENTNGLIRQYFPKKTDLRFVTADEVSAVTDKLNSRPRKALGYSTPRETFMRSLIG